MITLGSFQASRFRPGCAGALTVPRRTRRGLLSSHIPLGRKLFLEAKRSGRAVEADDEDGHQTQPGPVRGSADPASCLEYWQDEVSQMAFRDMQSALRERGLSASGKKDDLMARLADALLDEHLSAAGAAAGTQQPQADEGEEGAEEGAPEEDVAARVEAVLERLEEVSYPDLKRQCAERGLSTAGKKADLQLRLADAMVAAGEDLLAAEAGEEEEEEQEEGSSAPVPTDREALLSEFLALTVSELAEELRRYGAPSRGTKVQLAERLADLVLAEVAESTDQDDGEAQGEGEYDEAEEDEQEEGEESAARFDPALLTSQDRALLLADAVQRARSEHEGATRAALYQTLKSLQPRQPLSYGSKPVLLDQLSRTLGEQHLERDIEAAASDPKAAAQLSQRLASLRKVGPQVAGPVAEAPPAVNYDNLTITDIRRMRVEDLRETLRFLGMDSNGTKYEMMERLSTRVQSKSARAAAAAAAAEAAVAGGAPSAAISELVEAMGLRELRQDLDNRGLSTSGGKRELKARLVAELQKEASKARSISKEVRAAAAAAAAGAAAASAELPAPDETAEEAAVRQAVEEVRALASLDPEERLVAVLSGLQDRPELLVTMGREAPVDVAVVAGCLPGRLDLAQRSLAAARAMLDHLYTAPLPSPANPTALVAAPSPEHPAADAAAEDTQAAETDAAAAGPLDSILDRTVSSAPAVGAIPRPSTGAVVSVWWLDGTTGHATLLSPAQVYSASAAELAAGCWPAVHAGLLLVPPPSPLSLDHPVLQGPVTLATALEPVGEQGTGAGPTWFPDAAALAAHLRTSAHVVFPALPAGGPMYGELQTALEEAGVAHVGCTAETVDVLTDRMGVLQRLESLAYPVVPQLELSAADVQEAVRRATEAAALQAEKKVAKRAGRKAAARGPGQEEEEEDAAADAVAEARAAAVVEAAMAAVAEKVTAWCREKDLHPDRTLFVLRPRFIAGAATLHDTATGLGAAGVAEKMAQEMARRGLAALAAAAGVGQEVDEGEAEGGEEEGGEAGPSWVVEPAPPTSAARFVCTVVETPDGPVALLPSEVEFYDTEVEVVKHIADTNDWLGLREGEDEEELRQKRADQLALDVEPWRATFDPRVTLPFTTSVRMHTPPRFSRKLTHAVRHAAAKLFSQLGLRDAATVEGWVELPAEYEDEVMKRFRAGDEFSVPTLPDEDPYIVQRLADEEAAREAADPAPLSAYYDYGSSWHADLDQFDPALRLSGPRNGEGATVRVSAVTADLPLDPRHPAVVQAAEVGLPHGALIRNLANSALRRAAEAGDRRAQTPSEPYVSPPEAIQTAVMALAEAFDGKNVYEDEDGAKEEGQEEGKVEEEKEKEDREEEDVVALSVAIAEEAATPLEVEPQPLQLPMPPQIPLIHTAIMQHVREGMEFDTWVGVNDPDFWDDVQAPVRVNAKLQEQQQEMEELSGVPMGSTLGDAYDRQLIVADEKMLLDVAVASLGEIGQQLSAAITAMPQSDALEADAEVPLYRVKPLPPPDEVLPDGQDDTATDPRVISKLQLMGIAELARRHGWELCEAVDAEDEEQEREEAQRAELEALRAAGAEVPEQESAEAAAALDEEEQLVLEALCENEDEVMELRTGLITPVQLYLRYRARESRRPPNSHPLQLAAAEVAATEFSDDEGEDTPSTSTGLVAATSSTASSPDSMADPDAEQLGPGEVKVLLQVPMDAPEGTFGPYGPASGGAGDSSYEVFEYVVSPVENNTELSVPESARALASLLVRQTATAARTGKAEGRKGEGDEEAAEQEDGEGQQEERERSKLGMLAREVGEAATDRLDVTEWEALGLRDLGYDVETIDLDLEGTPVLAAVGPDPATDGLFDHTIVNAFGELATLPEFSPLARVLRDEGLLEDDGEDAADADSPDAANDDSDRGGGSTSTTYDESLGIAGIGLDWDDEDAVERGIARAAAEDGDAAWGGGEAAVPEPFEPEWDLPTTPYRIQADVEECIARGDLVGAREAAMRAPINPTRVWVVVGGDGYWAREEGLEAGANVIAKLSKYQDLVVEPFLMVPLGEGRNTDLVRAELLSRRTEYVAGVGMPEEAMGPYLDLQRIRSTPPMPTGRPETQRIYAVALNTVCRPSVPEALASLERTLQREAFSPHGLTEVQRQQRLVHVDVQAELAAAGMQGVASLWDDDVLGQPGPPPATPLDLAAFAENAAQAGAVVLITARGDLGDCGNLQGLLELNGVSYVGPGADQMAVLLDRLGNSDLLEDLHEAGIDAPPRFTLDWEDMDTVAGLTEEEGDKFMAQLRDQLVEGEAAAAAFPLLARTSGDSGACGVAPLHSGADAVAFAAALQRRDHTLPANTLSRPHADIPLPAYPPAFVIFEPLVETDALMLVVPPANAAADAASSSSSSAQGGEEAPQPEAQAGKKTATTKKGKESKQQEQQPKQQGGEEEGQEEMSQGSVGRRSVSFFCRQQHGWLDVSFALLGPLGGMRCLPLAMRAAVVPEEWLQEAVESDQDYADRLAAATEVKAAVLREEYEQEMAAAAAAEAAEEALEQGLTAPDPGPEEEEEDEETKAQVAEVLAAGAAASAEEEVGPAPYAVAALLAHSGRTWVVPPPEELLSAEAAEAACQRAMRVVDRLGLRGLVQIRAFVAADTGDLVVYDISGNPDLSSDSPVYRQAAADGMLPHDLLRDLISLAIVARAAPDAANATFDSRLEAEGGTDWEALDEAYSVAAGNEAAGDGDLEEDDGEEDEELDGEGGRSGLGRDDEEDDMLGQLEEMRVGGGGEEEAEEDDQEEGQQRGSGAGGRQGGGGFDDEPEAGAAGSLYFDDEEEGGRGSRGRGVGAGGGMGGGYMGLDEFGAGGKRGRGGSRGSRDLDFDDDADF